MAPRPHDQPFDSSTDVARCLQEKRNEIMRRWDEAAREELEPARHESKPALYDEMPQFLMSIVDGLKTEEKDRQRGIRMRRRKKAESHGDERAKNPEFSLEQVLFEYHLLRDVIIESLEECRMRISTQDMAYMHTAVDEAMGVAAQRFADLRVAQEQMGVARLEMERDMRERFVSTLSHDLRTPLSAIRMSSQLLLRLAGQSEDAIRLSSRILADVDRMDQMIQDLLDANLIQAGQKIPLKLQPDDLKVIVTAAVEEQTSLHGNRFVLLSEGRIPGFWYGKGIRRAVENLLANAVKYGSSQEKITVTLSRRGEEALISVHNLGNPISPADQKDIFQQFRRTSGAQKSGVQGWGLGLTLVRGMTEAHGGSIRVESSQEMGTTFTLFLPIDPRPKVPGSV